MRLSGLTRSKSLGRGAGSMEREGRKPGQNEEGRRNKRMKDARKQNNKGKPENKILEPSTKLKHVQLSQLPLASRQLPAAPMK